MSSKIDFDFRLIAELVNIMRTEQQDDWIDGDASDVNVNQQPSFSLVPLWFVLDMCVDNSFFHKKLTRSQN